MRVALAANLEIESMLIHPTKWGYRNNKINKMKNKTNTTLELPEGSKATIAGKTLTVLLMLSMIVCAGSVIAVIWVNN